MLLLWSCSFEPWALHYQEGLLMPTLNQDLKLGLSTTPFQILVAVQKYYWIIYFPGRNDLLLNMVMKCTKLQVASFRWWGSIFFVHVSLLAGFAWMCVAVLFLLDAHCNVLLLTKVMKCTKLQVTSFRWWGSMFFVHVSLLAGRRLNVCVCVFASFWMHTVIY